ncbi:MAG: amino acid permease [Spirochaetota bacterium]
MNNSQQTVKQFGSFSGVFTPAVLTILGVIMYLRLGWVVGSVGLAKALLIIVLAHIVTVTTGLSIASLATNTRVGAGGFYAFISRSLGIEAGGSIGIPLFISQTLSISLYVIGFAETWTMLFPGHPMRIVLLCLLILLTVISYAGSRFAMRIQYLIMGLIVLSLVSYFTSPDAFSHPVSFEMTRSRAPFWMVFAVFFPAVTGIGSGVAMSGELKDPKKSLPLGILGAVATGFLIYVSIAVFTDGVASSSELVENQFIMVERSRFAPLIYAGIMGATFSSALGSIIAAPRILQALASDRVIPMSGIFAITDKKGNPVWAVFLTGAIVLVSLYLGDLDSIASLLTMFFLVTYSVINATVCIEKAIRIPSFRPSFRIPMIVPLAGVVWCTVVMFLINSIFAGAAYTVIILLYFSYVKRRLNAPFGDVRSGIFTAIAEWALRISMRLPHHEKSWKPNLIVPVKDPDTWSRKIDLIEAIVGPVGTLRIVTINEVGSNIEKRIGSIISHFLKKKETDARGYADYGPGYADKKTEITAMAQQLNKSGTIVTACAVDAINFIEGLSVVLQSSRGGFFPPNMIFLSLGSDPANDRRTMEMLALSVREKLGIIILRSHPQFRFGSKHSVNIWLRVGSPNKNLAVLTALQLETSWRCRLRLITTIHDESVRERARRELAEVSDLGRLNTRTELVVLTVPFRESLDMAPQADLNIFGLSENVQIDDMRTMSDAVKSSCLFITDSGQERLDV